MVAQQFNCYRFNYDTGKLVNFKLNQKKLDIRRILKNGDRPRKFQTDCTGILNYY